MNREFSRQEYWGRTAHEVVAGCGDPTFRWLAGSRRNYQAPPLALIRGEQ
jgi:hypothetical protein